MPKGGGRTLGVIGVTLAALVLAAACGSSTNGAGPANADGGAAADGGVDSGPRFTDADMRDAADAFNAVYCAAFEKHDKVSFQVTFGDMKTCLGAGGLVVIPPGDISYVDELAAPYAYGSSLTPDDLRACARALDLSTREKWVSFASERNVPDACHAAFFGSLPEGSSCGAWNQCASGRCLLPPNAPQGACGKCVDPKSEGQVGCQPNGCAAGFTCRGDDPTSMTCTRFAGVGEPCEPAAPRPPQRWTWEYGRLTLASTLHPCHDYLVCNAGKCETPSADGSCDPSVGCSYVPALTACVASHCDAVPLAQLGQSCGPLPATPLGFVPCANGLTCSKEDDAGVSTFVCKPVLRDDDACTYNPDYDHHCKRPDSRCYRGKCQQNGPAECAAPPVLP